MEIGGPLESYELAHYERSIAVGLDSVLHFMQAVLPHMRESGGKILNFAGTNPFEALGTRPNALGYPGDPERDIAPAAAFPCSGDADYITGHVLPVDGGQLELE